MAVRGHGHLIAVNCRRERHLDGADGGTRSRKPAVLPHGAVSGDWAERRACPVLARNQGTSFALPRHAAAVRASHRIAARPIKPKQPGRGGARYSTPRIWP